jgi:hypothetical protein
MTINLTWMVVCLIAIFLIGALCGIIIMALLFLSSKDDVEKTQETNHSNHPIRNILSISIVTLPFRIIGQFAHHMFQ